MDTIYALATAPGKAGVSVIRLSGPNAISAAEALAGALPAEGRTLRRLRRRDGEVLDEALILTFAAGRSFTLEPVVELHVHGSQAVISAIFRELGQADGLRIAEPGEFTRRAFENGRLDLSQVEGLADLIDAETEGQLRQAQRILSGALARKAESWREVLIRAAALIESSIDFAEEDVPGDVFPEVRVLIGEIVAELQAEVTGSRIAERIRDGFEVAIVGAPNVGKSTLLNYIAGRDAAITSSIPGTTRDVIEVRLDLDGLPVTLLDTAGLRQAADGIEQIGIERGRARAADADLRVHLVHPDEIPLLPVESEDIVVIGMADKFLQVEANAKAIAVSGLTGVGVPLLVEAIAARLKERASGVGVAVRERHRRAIMVALEGLQVALGLLDDAESPIEVVAEVVRAAIQALNSLVGRVDVEDILGEIFARFCIGK